MDFKKKYSENINKEVDYYYNKYKFDMNYDGKYRSYNNEGDAFKHTFMQAQLTLKLGEIISKKIGDEHENKPNNSSLEKNMDLWNNRKGREIAKEIKEEFPNWKSFSDREIKDIIAKKIIDKMKKGELITNPKKPEGKYYKDEGLNENKNEINYKEIINHLFKEEVKKNLQIIDKFLLKYGAYNNPEYIANAVKRIQNEKSQQENGHWVTINHNHVLIKD